MNIIKNNPQKSKKGSIYMSQTTTKNQDQQEQKNQDQNHKYLSNGIFTPAMINSVASFEERALNHGVSGPALSFLHHTSLPKGHPDHMSETNAQKEFFPKTPIGTIKNRALKAAQRIYMLLFCGQKEEEYLAKYSETHKLKSASGNWHRIPVEEKAELKTKKELMRLFRESKGLGTRGKLTDPDKVEAEAYITQHYDKAFKKIMTETKQPKVQEPQES